MQVGGTGCHSQQWAADVSEAGGNRLLADQFAELCTSNVRPVSALWLGLAAVIFLCWGGILLSFPELIARFSRKVQGEFWGGQLTPERTRYLGFGFVLTGVVAAGLLLALILRG